MTYPSDYRQTDRHTKGEIAENAFLAFMARVGIEVKDLRGDSPDAQVRFVINGLRVGTQMRDGWLIDGWCYKTIFTDVSRTANNDVYLWHSSPDMYHVLWVARGPDPDDPWPGSVILPGRFDPERPDVIQPNRREWEVAKIHNDWASLFELFIPEIRIE